MSPSPSRPPSTTLMTFDEYIESSSLGSGRRISPKERNKEMFYFTTDSAHLTYNGIVSDVKNHSSKHRKPAAITG